jgi:hypothetical protein
MRMFRLGGRLLVQAVRGMYWALGSGAVQDSWIGLDGKSYMTCWCTNRKVIMLLARCNVNVIEIRFSVEPHEIRI